MPPLIPNAITARFDDIVVLHNHECQKPHKIADCLTDTVLQPKTIEKINVKLALAVFHESTVNALKYFGFDDTASFVELFLKFWSTVLSMSLAQLLEEANGTMYVTLLSHLKIRNWISCQILENL